MSISVDAELAEWVRLACLWEATARKAGNVHPERSFSGLTYADFVASANAIAFVFAIAANATVGKLVFEAIRATRQVTQTNTNLGIVLLLAPMALAPRSAPLRLRLPAVLDRLTVADAELVYQAIRLAIPGGLGKVAQEDVSAKPTLPLREVMALAQERDLIARQYADGFRAVLDEGAPALLCGIEKWHNLEDAIIGLHLELLARHADSLIARKCGDAIAQEASRRARAVLDAGWPERVSGQDAFTGFDAWLRADGNWRNPGTTADLVTACIFAALRDNDIRLPLAVPWSRG